MTSALLHVDYASTADMDDGQPLPPFIENDAVWHVVRRSQHKTLWRRIVLKVENVAAVRCPDSGGLS